MVHVPLPCRVGILIAADGRTEASALDRFGWFLGAAFKIQDDVLNLVGGADWGKEIAGDLCARVGEGYRAGRTGSGVEAVAAELLVVARPCGCRGQRPSIESRRAVLGVASAADEPRLPG